MRTTRYHHSVVLDEDGVAWTCGGNENGELGRSSGGGGGGGGASDYDFDPLFAPAEVASAAPVECRTAAVAAGARHTIVVLEGGRGAAAFGLNRNGQLGTLNVAARAHEIPPPDDLSC